MLMIQCTKKLSEKLNIQLDNIDTKEVDLLYVWHVNLFVLNRRNNIILMNNKTYYNIVLYGLQKKDFERFNRVVLEAIEENFLAEGFDNQVIERYINNTKDQIFYTKTSDRSVLGQMNDFIFMTEALIKDYIDDNGTVNTIELNKTNNRSPMVQRKHCYGIDALKEALLKV